ncbi:MAG: hypothetical protein AAF496_08240 [Pseudomonadota bacterium]
MHILFRATLAWALICFPVVLGAQPSAQAVCQKMQAEGRNGPFSFEDCTCTYHVADAVLDDDIKALMIEAWYSGNATFDQIMQLPNPRRVERQLLKMERTMKKTCGLSK